MAVNGVIQRYTDMEDAKPSIKHRLIVSIEAEEKCGKNHFAFTAPGPIAFHSFDKGDEGVIEKFLAKGKKIKKAEYRWNVPESYSIQQAADIATPIWDKFKANYTKHLGICRTSIIDTGGEGYELLRLSRFGKLLEVPPHLFSGVNQEWKSLYRQAYDSSSNLIVLHRLKDEWENKMVNGKLKGNKTGNRVIHGYNSTYYETQVNCRAYKEDGQFKMLVFDCRQNPDLEGFVLEGDMCNFPTLAQLVLPDADPADWED